jgi:hypothetical protein
LPRECKVKAQKFALASAKPTLIVKLSKALIFRTQGRLYIFAFEQRSEALLHPIPDT